MYTEGQRGTLGHSTGAVGGKKRGSAEPGQDGGKAQKSLHVPAFPDERGQQCAKRRFVGSPSVSLIGFASNLLRRLKMATNCVGV